MSNGTRLVISTMRDEGPYILEWLAYHRAIGFTDFLIYTNDCRDGTDLLLDRLMVNGVVTHVRNEVLRRGPHKSALKYAREHPLYAAADWVYVCDVDEFLNIKTGAGQVQDLIGAYPDADAIPVTWRQFSHSGREEVLAQFTTQLLTDAEPETAWPGEEKRFVKSLFRPGPDVDRLGLHGPAYAADAAGRVVWGKPGDTADPLRPTAEEAAYDVAQVNHYAVRTVDAFLVKRDRGRANHTGETIGLPYWRRWCRGGVEDRSIQRHLVATRAEYDQLFADPIVAALHRGALVWHRQRAASLLEDPEVADLKGAILAETASADITYSEPAPSPAAAGGLGEAPAPFTSPRQENRRKLLEEMPKGGRCAEIGVWNGGFSREILDVTDPAELVLIDPWDLLAARSESEHTHGRHSDAAFMEGMYRNVSALYGDLDTVSIRKGFSVEVLESFPDDYFDWVYIDGNHLFDAVRRDLALSFRKVRPGGIVAGDDFFWKRDDRMHVREAVFDIMRELGISGRPKRFGQQYMLTVPETVAALSRSPG